MICCELNDRIAKHRDWSLRREKGIPNDKRLWVLACMDERLPVEEALGIGPGDAHIFRNAGGLVTDDAIRSAMLTTNFFGTTEIVIITHTECGMMAAKGEDLEAALREKGVDIDNVTLDPALPELQLAPQHFAKWIRTFEDLDEITLLQEAYLKQHPLIPDEVTVNAYIYEVESGQLRRPHQSVASRVNKAVRLREPI